MPLNPSRRLMVAGALAAWPMAAAGAPSIPSVRVTTETGDDCACGCASGMWVLVLPGVGGQGCRRILGAA